MLRRHRSQDLSGDQEELRGYRPPIKLLNLRHYSACLEQLHAAPRLLAHMLAYGFVAEQPQYCQSQ